jgi:hypothetical protein
LMGFDNDMTYYSKKIIDKLVVKVTTVLNETKKKDDVRKFDQN